jgi:hypothetical protein
MRREIIDFLTEICGKYRLGLTYIPDPRPNRDCWLVHKRGRAILNMSTEMFYQIPRFVRKRQFLPLIKRGLLHSLGGGSTKDQVLSPIRYGKIIING